MKSKLAMQEAKRLVAGLIDGQLAAGWPFESEDCEDLSDKEAVALLEALRSLRDRLCR